jgi:hypothetical protein
VRRAGPPGRPMTGTLKGLSIEGVSWACRYSTGQKNREYVWSWALGLEYLVTHGRKGPVIFRRVLAPVQYYEQ